MKSPKPIFKILCILFLITCNIGCDQATKKIATNHLQGVHKSYYHNTFQLLYAENTGAFLSTGSNLSPQVKKWGLGILPALILVGLLSYVLFSKQIGMGEAVAFSFILGGGISNVFDRIAYSKVVDFLNLGIGDLRTGIFNLADVAIMIGMFLLIWLQIRK